MKEKQLYGDYMDYGPFPLNAAYFSTVGLNGDPLPSQMSCFVPALAPIPPTPWFMWAHFLEVKGPSQTVTACEIVNSVLVHGNNILCLMAADKRN